MNVRHLESGKKGGVWHHYGSSGERGVPSKLMKSPPNRPYKPLNRSQTLFRELASAPQEDNRPFFLTCPLRKDDQNMLIVKVGIQTIWCSRHWEPQAQSGKHQVHQVLQRLRTLARPDYMTAL